MWERPLPLTVAASITYGCSLCHIRLQEGSLGHCVWEASIALSIFIATDGQESANPNPHPNPHPHPHPKPSPSPKPSPNPNPCPNPNPNPNSSPKLEP